MLGSSNHAATLHAQLQQALRGVVASRAVEELLRDRAALDNELLEAAQTGARALGLELDSVAVRDLSLSNDLKRAFAEVVKARQEGLAALERARGETAALRNLANAAQSLERNPALFQLRLLHEISQHPSSRLVLNLAGPHAEAPRQAGS
jgi:regulator of protease activity HflC (stomatin/prohibitin superfamily)